MSTLLWNGYRCDTLGQTYKFMKHDRSSLGINYILLVYMLMESKYNNIFKASFIDLQTLGGRRMHGDQSFLSSYFPKKTCQHFAVGGATILFIPCNQLSVTDSAFSSGLVSTTTLRKQLTLWQLPFIHHAVDVFFSAAYSGYSIFAYSNSTSMHRRCVKPKQ